MIGIYLLSVALGWIIMNYLSNTDDGTTYLGNSEFVIYITQEFLEMSAISSLSLSLSLLKKKGGGIQV
jgi:hypothetical protein